MSWAKFAAFDLSAKTIYALLIIQGLHGRLDLQHVTWTTVGDAQTASNLPNMPSGVTATWYSDIGVMKFESSQPLESHLWNRIFSQTLYRPTGRFSDATITFRMGIGGLPFFEAGNYRMYDFVEMASSPPAFDNATTLASSPGGAFCGMQSHLASISTEAEQEHLEDVMKTTGTTGWQSGWIGAGVTSAQTFQWVTGPQAGLPFWFGTASSGNAYELSTGQPSMSSYTTTFQYDQFSSRTGHRKRLIMQNDNTPTAYRYTNWAGGNDTVSCDSKLGVPVS